MALNFPSSPQNGQVFVSDGVTYTYNQTKDYWQQGNISKLLIIPEVDTYDGGIKTLIFCGIWDVEQPSGIHPFLLMGT